MNLPRYIVRTEESTIYTNKVIFKGCYAWVEEDRVLYRILDDKEIEKADIQPDALITAGDVKFKACRVANFQTAEKAFDVMEHNDNMLKAALISDGFLNSRPSEDKKLFQTPSNAKKTYAANYLFNYFGRDQVEDKIIVGAWIDVAIRPFKDGKIVQFQCEEETCFSVKSPSRVFGERKDKFYLTSGVSVHFDRDSIYRIDVDWEVINFIRNHFGWDSIEIEAVGWGLDYEESKYVSIPWNCGKEIFEEFIRSHLDDFDISDNVNAQCPSYSWIDQ